MITAPSPALRLDEAAHTAHLGDRELIRVTTALAEAGLIDTTWFTEDSRTRGRYLHDAISLHHQCDLDEDGLDEVLRPFWGGYLAFLSESGFEALAVEQPVYDEQAGYAGRYDLFGRLPNLPPTAYDLVDVKTGRAAAWVKVQTAAYRRRLMYADAPVVRCRRWALELPGDGSFRLLALNLQAPISNHQIDRAADQRHEAVFLAALQVAQWKRGMLR